MKTKILMLLLLGSFSFSFTQVNYQVRITTQVGEGIVHKHLTVPANLWNINVLEIDLTNPYLAMKSVKANDRLQGYEATSSMAARNSYEGHRVVGAVNGDFYVRGGVPINTQVIDGEILKNPINRPTLGFDIVQNPIIGVVGFGGTLVAGAQQYSFAGVNQDRMTDQLVLYNSFFGGSTGTNVWGYEYQVAPLTDWIVNDTLMYVIEGADEEGDMTIPRGKAVISGHGAAATFLQNNIQVGDTVEMVLNLQPSLPKLHQLIGGNLKIVDNGVFTGSSNTDVHPRTAAGISEDGKTIYLVTVDGRVPDTYRGMSYKELAELMIYLGAYEAVNLDGGGSTTMVVRGEVMNHPSDGTERNVANALLSVSMAPEADSVAHIQVEPDNERVFLKNSRQLTVTGWDEHFHPVEIDRALLQYQIDPSLGQIDENGLLTVANQPDSGYLYVHYNELVDSAYIYIKGILSIDLQPESVLTDTFQAVQFKVIPTDVDYLHPNIPATDYQWTCLDPAVGSIDSLGRFRGVAEGEARIVASYQRLSDTSLVRVEIGRDVSLLEAMDSKEKWEISGVLYDPQATLLTAVDTPRTEGSSALRLDYQFVRSSEGRSWVYLNTDLPVYGLPDTFLIDIKSNQLNHIADLIISDDNEELFTASTGLFSTESSDYQTYKIPLSKFNPIDPASSFNFPSRVRSLQIKLWYQTAIGDTNQGTLYFDNLRVKYPTVTGIEALPSKVLPQGYRLHQNYPNPFNPFTTIRYELPHARRVRLDVFDVLGRKVETLVNGREAAGLHSVSFAARDLASGIFYYRLQAGDVVRVKKMLLVR